MIFINIFPKRGQMTRFGQADGKNDRFVGMLNKSVNLLSVGISFRLRVFFSDSAVKILTIL